MSAESRLAAGSVSGLDVSGLGPSERAWADPHRPRFHFVAPAGWLNDPNGVGQWRGRFHLFYQYNPDAPVHDRIHWGHASSDDLVHWDDEPVALSPGTGPDRDGCWSGVLVGDGGDPVLVFSGHRDDVGQRACLAYGSADLRTWRKDPGNPVIAEPPAGVEVSEFRDHCVWREGGEWRHLVGAGIRGRGGAALLYRSEDLRSWEYVGPLLVGDAAVTDPVWTGSVWECVDLFRIGDVAAADAAGSDVLVFSAWDDGVTHHSAYSTGRYSGDTFTPARTGLLDLGLNHFYAPQSFRDDTGRRVMFGWLQEGRGADACVEAGWSGVMSLPREVRLDEHGELAQEPVAEMASLRGERRRLSLDGRAAGEPVRAEVGVQVEVEIEAVVPEGAVLTVGLRESGDGEESTLLEVRADQGLDRVSLGLDRSRSSLDADVDKSPRSGTVRVGADRRARLRLLVDRSALEVFANGRALSARVYPTRADATGLSLSVTGGAVVESAAWWPMADVWHGPRPTRP